jgi:predicted transcriptional regulator
VGNDEPAASGSREILGPLGRRVMERLWTAGPQSVSEVLEALNADQARPLAYTTVMTILVRLFEKGYLSREREDRHFRYTAMFDEASLEAQVGRQELGRLIERYGLDSVAGFAADIVGTDSPLAERLQALIDQRKTDD